MDALELLLQRRSVAKLTGPAPQGEALDNILNAALRAPDHGVLTPWRFVIAQGDGLGKLADILVRAAKAENSEPAVIDKLSHAPFRAPMVITVIAEVKDHPKVPYLEQYLSAGCTVQAMQLAAVAQGFQGFWRSGPWMFHADVRDAFGLKASDQIVGFLYLGTPAAPAARVPTRKIGDFVSYL